MNKAIAFAIAFFGEICLAQVKQLRYEILLSQYEICLRHMRGKFHFTESVSFLFHIKKEMFGWLIVHQEL